MFYILKIKTNIYVRKKFSIYNAIQLSHKIKWPNIIFVIIS